MCVCVGGQWVVVKAPGAPLFDILYFQIRLFFLFTYGVFCPKGLKTSAGKHPVEMQKHFRSLAQKKPGQRKQVGESLRRDGVNRLWEWPGMIQPTANRVELCSSMGTGSEAQGRI